MFFAKHGRLCMLTGCSECCLVDACCMASFWLCLLGNLMSPNLDYTYPKPKPQELLLCLCLIVRRCMLDSTSVVSKLGEVCVTVPWLSMAISWCPLFLGPRKALTMDFQNLTPAKSYILFYDERCNHRHLLLLLLGTPLKNTLRT
jgi:hypothetical protein